MDKLIALKVKCPICKTTLMDPYRTINGKPSINLDVKINGQMEQLRLCAYYGCYDHESSTDISKGKILEFYCPHCHEKLISKHTCEQCDAPMVPLALDKGGRIYICSTMGCEKHYLNFDKVSDALRKMYNEFGYF